MAISREDFNEDSAMPRLVDWRVHDARVVALRHDVILLFSPV